MKKTIQHSTLLLLSSLIFLNSCNKENPVSVTEKVENKKEEVAEIANEVFPDDVVVSLLDIPNNIPENEQEEYLDTLKVSVEKFRESLLKNHSIRDLEEAFNRVQTSAQKVQIRQKLQNIQSALEYLRLGYGKGASLNGTVEAGFVAGIGATLDASSGGGIEVLYDFVNLDREVYTTKFCAATADFGIGGDAQSLGLIGGSVGFTGMNKWLFNIETRQRSGKFEGASRAATFGLSADIEAGIGVDDLGLSIGKAQDIFGSDDFTNLLSCPSTFNNPLLPGGVKEYFIEVGTGFSAGASLSASFEVGGVGTFRSPVQSSYNSFGKDEFGRKVAALRMSTELLLSSFTNGLNTLSTSSDLIGVAFALMYGSLDYEFFEEAQPVISVSPEHINVSSNGSNESIIISNLGAGNLQWLVTTEDDWIEIEESSGSGSSQVDINVLENTDESLRSGEIIINSNGGEEQTILIQQEGIQDQGSDKLFSDNFNDGDFENNPVWTENNANIVPATLTAEDNFFYVNRSGAGGSGQCAGIEKELNIEVNNQTKISFDVRASYSSVRNGSGDNNGEFPINVHLDLKDNQGEEFQLRFAYNYRGGSDRTVGNFVQVGFGEVQQDEWIRDEKFLITDYQPDVTQVTNIWIGGCGWDFEGSVDNILIE